MRVFRCPCHPRRAAFATCPRLSPFPRCVMCRLRPASCLPPRCVMHRIRDAPRPRLPPRGKVSRSDGRGELAPFLSFLLRRPARPFINHQNKKPRHSVLRVFLHSHINKTKNAAPCASSSCAHKSPKQNTSPRAPPRAPSPLRKTKDGAPCGAPISHNKSKRYVYFFPFQQ